MPSHLPKNPYTNRAAIRVSEDFFGRTAELKAIYTRIEGGQSVSLVGERRIGKSSLLNALEFERDQFEISPDFCFVPIDMQYIADCTTDIFQEYLLSRISEMAEVEVGEPSRLSLQRVAANLGRQGRKLVVILDEFDVLIHNPKIPIEFFSFLRAWVSEFQIPFVVASREGSIDQMAGDEKTGSAFLNIFGTVYVGPMQKEDAEELIRSPSEIWGVVFTEDEVALILSLAGFFPLFLQIMCYHMFDLKLSNESADGTVWPDREQIERTFAFEATPHFEYLMNRLTDPELATLHSFVVDGVISEKSAKDELLRKGVLLEFDSQTRIFSTAFRDLIRPQATKGSGALHAVMERILE